MPTCSVDIRTEAALADHWWKGADGAKPEDVRAAQRLLAELAEASRWTAILTIAVQTPRTPDALRKNPLGIFVNAINWSKELGS